ncbi:hypothetical protein LOD99_4546 [Oopsacas minuta]|uniref:Uncharacterized protein n=1 Tax=Oopsacas minuta TaxID=111878 RepID=A0AAV7JUW7_9METZ|nr:hypothetical protein LOD99_4546 [Oopsacas minuta]
MGLFHRHFKKLPYGAIELLAGQSPLKISRPIGSHPVLMRRKRIVYRPNVKSEASLSNVITTLPQQAPLTLQPIDNPDRKIKKISVSKQRPLGGRRDKEKRELEKFKFKVREDSAFAPSSATLPQVDRTVNSPDEQEGVIYPSNNLEETQHTSVPKQDSVIKAETYYPLAEGEVEDAPGLVTEKPVDLLPTEEVHEESVDSVQPRIQTQQNDLPTADHSITETSIPVDQVDVQPHVSSIEPNIPDPQRESTQIEDNSLNVTDLQDQPKIAVTNEDNQVIAADSTEADNGVTFDKSDTSVTDNIPVITNTNQTQLETAKGICINDAITHQQLKQLERDTEEHLRANENNVSQGTGDETKGAHGEGNNSANNGST